MVNNMKKLLTLCLGVFSIFLYGCKNETHNSSSSTSFVENENYIYSAKDLQKIKDNLAGDFELKNDITLPARFTGIGTKETPFSGMLNGNGFKIIGNNTTLAFTNFYDNSETINGVTNFAYDGFAGIFNYNVGTIQNLNITGTFQYQLATLPKLSDSGVSYTAYTLKYKTYVGCLVGYNDGVIEKINLDATLKGNDSLAKEDVTYVRTGLLCGKNTKTITKCFAKGNMNIQASYGKNARIGGLVGSTGTSNQTLSAAEVTINASTINANLFLGGLIGYMEGGNIQNCYAKSKNLSANGSIQSKGNARLGGFVGYIETTKKAVSIENCYADISDCEAIGKKVAIAGFVGEIEQLENVDIHSCFTNTKNISFAAKDDTSLSSGYFIASVVESAVKTGNLNCDNNFYLTQLESNLNTLYATYKEKNELPSLLSWDFANIWTMDYTLRNVSFYG